MTFEVARTVTEYLWNGVKCNLHYTPEFVDYTEEIDGTMDELDTYENGIFDSMENFVRENDIVGGEINVTAFISEENTYVYIDTVDQVYILAVLPMGNGYKYRACIVNTAY